VAGDSKKAIQPQRREEHEGGTKRLERACSRSPVRNHEGLSYPILEGRSRTIKSFLLLFFKKEGLA
jgi:hypothetical protein